MFIILTTATVQGIQVNLPKASSQPSLAEPRTKAITITEDGTIFLDTYPVTLSEVGRFIDGNTKRLIQLYQSLLRRMA